MRIFNLYITTAKRHKERLESQKLLIDKLRSERDFLQKSVERLLAIVKGSRQVRRGAERRLAKNALEKKA